MLGTDARRIFAELGHQVLAHRRRPGGDKRHRAAGHHRHARGPNAVCRASAGLGVSRRGLHNVDGCERDPDLAYKVNALGTWAVASAAEAVGAALVAISTDFVFDGTKTTPYTEFDTPNPLGQYAASKLAGENLARSSCRRCYVVRTSWLYGVHGRNFPYTVINLAKSKPELPIVADQYGTPTYTVDLVNAVLDIISTGLYGVYHVSNGGETNWEGFAQAILAKTNLSHIPVVPITSDDYAQRFGSPTKRPPYSVMRHYALELMGRDTLRPWEDALDAFLASAREHGKI